MKKKIVSLLLVAVVAVGLYSVAVTGAEGYGSEISIDPQYVFTEVD